MCFKTKLISKCMNETQLWFLLLCMCIVARESQYKICSIGIVYKYIGNQTSFSIYF